MKYLFVVIFLFAGLVATGQQPMEINVSNSAYYRWLNKEIHESKTLDNMENEMKWISFTGGAIALADSRIDKKEEAGKKNYVETEISADHKHQGNNSLRMIFPSRLDIPAPKSGRGWCPVGIRFNVNNEDWRRFNRISVWIFPDNPGAYSPHLELRLFNDGAEKLPALFGQEGESIFNLKNHEWNHVVWEIENVARDMITKVEISTSISGHEPEACDSTTYYFDDLALEKVDPDYIEGWPVWKGRIAYSHTGYMNQSPKTAILNDPGITDFKIVDDKSGKTVLNKKIINTTTGLGDFQILDFSEVNESGSYHIVAGKTISGSFRIEPDVWEETLWKALNFFYVERCGTPIPGVHGACHRDWTCIHDDKRIVINGGWHDAGDLTQGLRNTAEATYAMFSLAEQVHLKGRNQKLYERLIKEAQWGLDWILKTSFGDGFRNEGSVNSRRTNGIIGDYDDVTSTARNNPKTNFIAASSEAIAYRILKETDPRLANYALKMAKADWQFAIDKLVLVRENDSSAAWGVSFDSGDVLHEIASAGILASVELWNATGDKKYEEKAAEMATMITESQQRKKPAMDIPLTGFFYTGPSKKFILHYCHNGREQEPIAALTLMCEAFPDNPDYMNWYSSVVLHSEYLKTIAGFTEPYGIIPSSIYKDKDYLQVYENRRESFRKQVLNGVPLGNGNYLRLFPVWMDYRGHFGVILPQAQALNYAARLRGDAKCMNLAIRQLEWVVGNNPFSQSTMYGEGYDFPPLYTPSSGDIIGALPVGIQTRGESDIPYWPVQNTWTYKEVWVHPVSQWIGIMREVERLSGKHETSSKPENDFHIKLSKSTTSAGKVTITATIEGSGTHTFNIRSSNLIVKSPEKKITLISNKKTTLKWQAMTTQVDEPWVALIVMDNDINTRSELTGSTW
ncbi:MAG TPA: glycoside hydrolase family 9 protein [Bacteroidales bacterium]|nr:glycoside hydrolase family 9 protein [Bacteroidales bacterium]